MHVLDAKWSECFSRIEAMFMVRTLQTPAGQSTFPRVSVPVSAGQPPVHLLHSSSLPDRPVMHQLQRLPVPVCCQIHRSVLILWMFCQLPRTLMDKFLQVGAASLLF